MASLARHRLTPAETGPALGALCEWTLVDAPGGGVHPGDVGWHLRFDDAAVLLWLDGLVPVAAGFLDSHVLRVSLAPGADLGAIAADAQRSAFAASTFTVERWETMKQSPAGGLAVEAIVRTPTGEPAAAATGWFAGVGRCGLLEPVGTHPDHRGHGYGRDAVLGTCAALAQRGASAVAVATVSTNEAAVGLYRSAGFTVVRENRDWVRGARP